MNWNTNLPCYHAWSLVICSGRFDANHVNKSSAPSSLQHSGKHHVNEEGSIFHASTVQYTTTYINDLPILFVDCCRYYSLIAIYFVYIPYPFKIIYVVFLACYRKPFCLAVSPRIAVALCQSFRQRYSTRYELDVARIRGHGKHS